MDCLLSVYLMCLWLQQLNMIMLSSLTYKRIHTAQKFAQEEKHLPEYIIELQIQRSRCTTHCCALQKNKHCHDIVETWENWLLTDHVLLAEICLQTASNERRSYCSRDAARNTLCLYHCTCNLKEVQILEK